MRQRSGLQHRTVRSAVLALWSHGRARRCACGSGAVALQAVSAVDRLLVGKEPTTRAPATIENSPPPWHTAARSAAVQSETAEPSSRASIPTKLLDDPVQQLQLQRAAQVDKVREQLRLMDEKLMVVCAWLHVGIMLHVVCMLVSCCMLYHVV